MKSWLPLGVLAILWADPIVGQSASAGAGFQQYTMTEAAEVGVHSVELLTVPFSADASLGDDVTVRLNGAYARGALRLGNGLEKRTMGWTDTGLAVHMGGENLRFTATALIPTGDVVRDAEDAALVGLLASELMPFAIAQWSTGGGLSGEIAYTLFGPHAALSVSAGGTRFGASEPLGGTPEYRPGWQLQGRASLDVAVGPAGQLSALFGYQHYGVDRYARENLFEPGPRLEATLSYAAPLSPWMAVTVFGGARHLRGGVARFDPDLLAALESAWAGAGSPSPRTLFLAGSELRVVGRGYVLRPHVAARVLRRADGLGQGWSTTAGAQAEVPILGRSGVAAVVVEPRLALRLGRWAAARDVGSGIMGWETGVTVRWSGGS